ncbi:MAG: universal stress protein [Ignavibacteria bacterium]|nr:universal stress protein [Ignavibacteria bacterium]
MKKILVPTDFSKCSIFGLDFASILAKRSQAEIHIFNAILTTNYYYAADPFVIAPPASVMAQSINENLKKASLAKLKKISQRNSLNGLKLNIHCETTTNVHYEILNYADNIKADIIIMGTKGAGNLKDILIGSTAERVARFSSRPVLVMPSAMKKTPGKIVFASDFTDEAYGIFPFVRNFAEILNAEIRLLKVNTTQQFKRTQDDVILIKNFLKKFGSKYKWDIYNDYMKEEGILSFAEDINADMIAIGTHGKKGLARFLRQDVSEGVIRLSKKPVLIVNLKKYKNKADIIK